MIKESKIMKEIHKIREKFSQETKGKTHEYILKRIKEDSQKMVRELENVPPVPQLIVRKKYPIPQSKAKGHIYQIRERSEKYRRK